MTHIPISGGRVSTFKGKGINVNKLWPCLILWLAGCCLKDKILKYLRNTYYCGLKAKLIFFSHLYDKKFTIISLFLLKLLFKII